jgi:hypothetical protein
MPSDLNRIRALLMGDAQPPQAQPVAPLPSPPAARQGGSRLPLNATEEALERHLLKHYRRTSYSDTAARRYFQRTGMEHGCFDLVATAFRFSPDFLLKSQLTAFLEVKNSSHAESITIKPDSLDAYIRWEAFTGIPVFIVTMTRPVIEGRLTAPRPAAEQIGDFVVRGEFVVRRARDIAAESAPQALRRGYWASMDGQGDWTDPVHLVPRSSFTWPLDDLLKQADQPERKRFIAPRAPPA